jgi:hypothetical protein
MEKLERLAQLHGDSCAGTEPARLLGDAAAGDFFVETDGTLALRQPADPETALARTDQAVARHRESQDEALNLAYHELIDRRVAYLCLLDENRRAASELLTLRDDLSQRGVHPPVLDDIERFANRLLEAGRASPSSPSSRRRPPP